MEREDYIKRQIDQLSRLLGKIISNIIGLKQNGLVGEVYEFTKQSLKNELDFDLDELIALPDDEFIKELKLKTNLNGDNLDKLANIFFLLAENSEQKETLYKKCLIIYEYLEESEKTYSLERRAKTAQIKQLLASS